MGILIAYLDTVFQRSIEEDLHDVRRCFHSSATRLDRPWLPFVSLRHVLFKSHFSKIRRTERHIPIFRLVTTYLRSAFQLHWCFSCRRSIIVQIWFLIIISSDVDSTPPVASSETLLECLGFNEQVNELATDPQIEPSRQGFYWWSIVFKLDLSRSKWCIIIAQIIAHSIWGPILSVSVRQLWSLLYFCLR